MPLDSYTGEYVPPPVREGMQVLVSRESNFTSLLTGQVIRIKAGGKSVDIAAWSPNGSSMAIDIFYNCMHLSDPRVKNKPELIDQDIQRGVWDVGPAEKDRQYMNQRIQELQERCSGMEVMYQTLARQVTPRQSTEPRFEEPRVPYRIPEPAYPPPEPKPANGDDDNRKPRRRGRPRKRPET